MISETIALLISLYRVSLPMATYRALLTDREREILSGEATVSQNYVYQIRSRVRDKIDRLGDDIEFLEAHQSDLYERLESVLP